MVTPVRLDDLADIAPPGTAVPLGDTEGGQGLLSATFITSMTASQHGSRNVNADTNSSNTIATTMADRIANGMRRGVSGLEDMDLAWDVDTDMVSVSYRRKVRGRGSRSDGSRWVLGRCDNGDQVRTCALDIRGNREVRRCTLAGSSR